ncbi:hypothetical protein AJ80_05836 [Polytolypa hystricis UAMH7299]|uniref:Amino acid permease/ SLC12A domain-containing protein n=1 Tax=Polytolypa hystricis (strain UAMH7299) TaxID=1447883 RepID=A0A2B7Y0D5_POLH7|nr:hypothetical protein AJ80_05836 [Polytolypa hystricis UAMH7299]
MADGNNETNAFSREELNRAIREYNEEIQLFDTAPTSRQLLGSFTIFCLIMNRTIGSGIFTVAPKLLSGSGNVGGSLLVWLSGGVIILCGAVCWIQLGLTIPMHTTVENGQEIKVSTPRNGGEKNFLEYIYKKPAFLMTAVFGINFIFLGNVSGNALAFGVYVMIAAGRDPIGDAQNNFEKGPVIALAISVLTICTLLHSFSRSGGILVNNIFAVLKVTMLLVITLLGFVHAGGKFLQSDGINETPSHTGNYKGENITSEMINSAMSRNFDINTSFSASTSDVGSTVIMMFNAIYPFSGFEQPFYILSEVARPRRQFPRAVVSTIIFTIVLYLLVNISYYCVVPKETYLSAPTNTIDMAGTFFHYLFDSTGASNNTGERAVAGMIAFSIFGNIFVQTFTTARMKQEIAKEGIIPKALYFATGKTTPWARLRSRFSRKPYQTGPVDAALDLDEHLEQTPMAALGLHWFTSIFLVAVTSMLRPAVAYSLLVYLFSYVNVGVWGLLTAGGLLYLHLDSYIRGPKGRNWANKVVWLPFLSPLPEIIYFLGMGFVLFAAFVKPGDNSPFADEITGYAWYIIPAVGLASLGLGAVWWVGLLGLQWKQRCRLEVRRKPYLEKDRDGEYVQRLELVEHEWLVNVRR